MYYKAELDYLMRVLKKMHLPVRRLRRDDLPEGKDQLNVRYFLGLTQEYERTLQTAAREARKNVIFKLSDMFRCHYLLLSLPLASENEILLLGPYSDREISREELLEAAERFRIPVGQISQMEDYYANIALIPDETALLTIVIAFGETLWGSSDSFEIVDVEQDLDGVAILFGDSEEGDTSEDIMLRMKAMETRYAYENELMDLVSQGHYHRAELMLSNFTGPMFEQRMADPIRNIKNYGIIFNTLLRKAAERGGVHPIHLDSTSAYFARRIEASAGASTGTTLMLEMVRTYCRLVRKHAANRYSPPVQRTTAYIETNLTGDLSLHNLAALQNISDSYLSALFRKETGKTLTEFVNEKRMEAGAHLLRTTRLQVQTIAQRCGMSDVNYFSKLFKKYSGITPKQFREENHRYWKEREAQG